MQLQYWKTSIADLLYEVFRKPSNQLYSEHHSESNSTACHFTKSNTAWKVSKYRVFSGMYLTVFVLITGRYSVSPRIQSECRKIQTRKKLRIWTLFTQDKLLLMVFFSHWLERIDFYTAYYYTKNPLKFMLLFMSHIFWFNMWFFNTVAVKTPLLYARLILQVAYYWKC